MWNYGECGKYVTIFCRFLFEELFLLGDFDVEFVLHRINQAFWGFKKIHLKQDSLIFLQKYAFLLHQIKQACWRLTNFILNCDNNIFLLQPRPSNKQLK